MIYLYVKQHSVTGMKYFGMTRRDPFKYNGSGKYWKRHIAKYGKDQIKTVEVYSFDEQSICTEFALKFSHDNNIVESKEWANLQLENGVDGGVPGQMAYLKGRKQHKKWAEHSRQAHLGYKHSDHTKEVLREKALKRRHTSETKAKISQIVKGRKQSEETIRKRVEARRKTLLLRSQIK